MRKLVVILSAVVCALAQLAGCDGGDGFDVPYRHRPSRYLGLRFGDGSKAGVAPHEVRVFVSIRPGEQDRGEQTLGEKVEVNWSDDGDWQDVTDAVHSMLTSDAHVWGAGVPQSEWLAHTYLKPGKYYAQVRLTWWDGEVMYRPSNAWLATAGENDYPVTVLPPEEE
jgi:hypothetical protein